MKKLLTCCVGATLALLLGGCAGQAQTEAEPEPEPEVVEEVTYTIVGEQTAGDVEVLTTNNLGQAITTLTLKEAQASEPTPNLVAAGTEIAANEQFLLCFEPAGGVKATSESAAKTENDEDSGTTSDTTFTSEASDTAAGSASNAVYEMTVGLVDGTNYVLPGLALENYEKMELVVSDGLASVTYTTLDGKTGDTIQASKDAAAAAQEAADEAAAQAAADAEMTRSASIVEDEDVDYGYSSGSSSSSSSSSAGSSYDYDYDSGYSGGSSAGSDSYGGGSIGSTGGGAASTPSDTGASAPAQGEDSCVDDVIFND